MDIADRNGVHQHIRIPAITEDKPGGVSMPIMMFKDFEPNGQRRLAYLAAVLAEVRKQQTIKRK